MHFLYKFDCLCTKRRSLAGLEKSAAIRPFATKKSHLASEKNPFSGQFGDWKLPFSGQVGDQTLFQSGQRRCGPNVIAQGLWQMSLSVQDAKELAVRARRSCLRVNPPRCLGILRCLPWDSPSETIWALWGGENIVRAVIVSLRGTLVSTRVLFSWCLSRASAPKQRQRQAFSQRRLAFGQRRREEFKEEGSKEDGDKAPAAKRGECSKKPVKCSSPTYSYTRINCRYSYKDKPNKQHYNHFKNTTVVRFSALVDLATEISAILPLWRLKLSVYFHLGEYYWKDFSSPAWKQVVAIHGGPAL